MSILEMICEGAEDARRGRMTSLHDVRNYVLAGNSTFTIVGAADRYTYRVAKVPEGEGRFFVSVLVGPDNENSYQYLGLIRGRDFSLTKKSRLPASAPSVRAFLWYFGNLMRNSTEQCSKAEFWHEGRCGRCGRKLTVPASVERGIGPECADRMGM